MSNFREVARQVAELAHYGLRRGRWGDVEAAPHAGGLLVTLRDYKLPPGLYNVPRSGVRLFVPPGYPFACPAGFWLDEGVRLASGGFMRYSGFWYNHVGGLGYCHPEGTLYVAVRLQAWSVLRDTLLNYAHVVRRRLECCNEDDEAEALAR